MSGQVALIPEEQIEQTIFVIRGLKVMLDADLARLYGVSTGRLNEQVRRNIKRFPADFMLQLTAEEAESLRSQNAILNVPRRGKHRKYLPYVFTEQGIAMLSGILHSDRAIRVNIEIMRAFVRLRHITASNKELSQKLVDMEKKYDFQFKIVFETIDQWMEPEDPSPDEKPNFTKVKGFGP